MVESSQKNTANVVVGVRVRPPLPREIKEATFNNCVAIDDRLGPGNSKIYVSMDSKPIILTGSEVPPGVTGYTFDNCFKQDCTQSQVYQSMVSPAVKAVLNGFNATVFAYG